MLTPVAFFVFNRPALTARVFETIRQARPATLLVVADGPRATHDTDQARCAAVREIIATVDWPCDVKVDFAARNLGCKRRVTTGLDWVFSQSERAIVLEDDCLPTPDFFRFCERLLDRYAENDSVFAITGDNFQRGRWRGQGDYYFSRYLHIWGWATWHRAWARNQPDIPFWPEWRASRHWLERFERVEERNYWEQIFDRVHHGLIDTWDYSWVASAWFHDGLTATPNVNLIENIGFGADSTHTNGRKGNLAPAAGSLSSVRPPASVERDSEADRFTFDHAFGGKSMRGFRGKLARAKAATYRWFTS